MERFAKIFEGNGHQVLVKKEVVQDEDVAEFSAALSHNGNQFKNTFTYHTREECDKMFDEFDHDMAMEFIKAMGVFISMSEE